MRREGAPRVEGPLYESYSRPGSGLQRFRLRAMGTENVILLAGEDDPALRAAAQEAFETIERLEERLSKFLPESELSLVNRLAAFRPVSVGDDLLTLLRLAREAWEITEGAFDPTVGPLLEAWGLVDLRGRRPDEAEIARLLALRGMDLVEVDEDSGTVRYARPGIALDLGAIGKGYAVDLVVRRLRERGIPAGAVISGRSTVATWGEPPREDRWRIEVADPRDPDESLSAFLAEPGAVSSSGAYERRVRVGAEEFGHIIDPRTGCPVRRLLGTTVWTRRALGGDVVSTALYVLGEDGACSDGPVERLIRAWTDAGEEPRASLLWSAPNPRVWGGMELRRRDIGSPALVEDAE